jgi:hypothetical protein
MVIDTTGWQIEASGLSAGLGPTRFQRQPLCAGKWHWQLRPRPGLGPGLGLGLGLGLIITRPPRIAANVRVNAAIRLARLRLGAPTGVMSAVAAVAVMAAGALAALAAVAAVAVVVAESA